MGSTHIRINSDLDQLHITLFINQSNKVGVERIKTELTDAKAEVITSANASKTDLGESLRKASDAFKEKTLNHLRWIPQAGSRFLSDFECAFQEEMKKISDQYQLINDVAILNISMDIFNQVEIDCKENLCGLSNSNTNNNYAKCASVLAVSALAAGYGFYCASLAALSGMYFKWDSNCSYQKYKNSVVAQARITALCCHVLSQPTQLSCISPTPQSML